MGIRNSKTENMLIIIAFWNGLPRRPIGPPRNDKALQSVPIQNLRKIPVFFKYRHNKQSNRTALCNDTFYHGMGGFSRGELKVSERQMNGTTEVHPLSGGPTQGAAPTASYDGFCRGGPLCPPAMPPHDLQQYKKENHHAYHQPIVLH